MNNHKEQTELRVQELSETLAQLKAQHLITTHPKIVDILDARIKMVEENLNINRFLLGE